MEEVDRVSELVRDLQRYQKMKVCPRLPTCQDFEKELTRRDGAENQLKTNNKGTFTLVAIDLDIKNEGCPSSNIVGYLMYSLSFSIVEGKSIWINSFFIQEGYRKQGLGRKFIETMGLHAKSLGVCTVDVPVMNDNDTGLKFYQNYRARLVNDEFQIMAKILTG